MSSGVLVIAESGQGKSASLRNLDPEKTLLVQAIEKRLPFPNAQHWQKFNEETKKGNVFVTDNAATIEQLMVNTKRKIIVLDDFQYVMANEFMRRSDEKGYDKFTEIGRHAWNILMKANQLAPDVRVYILAHADESDSGRTRMKTIGKMLNEKITVEGLFTIVLRAVVRDGEYLFQTHNSGNDTVKTPMGMFKEDLIDNDLAAVDRRICEYWGITP
jgi:hypothetical protein